MSLTTIAGFAALVLGWLLPGHYVPWPSFQQEWMSALGAALIGIGVVMQTWRAEARVPPLALFVLLVACIPPMQYFSGQILFHADALLATLYLCGFALMMAAGATSAALDADRFHDALFGAFVIAGAIAVGMAATQWLQLGPVSFVDPLSRGARPYANFGQPNHLATLLAMASVGMLWFFESNRIGPVGTWVGLAWFGVGMLMTQSRTAWLFVLMVGLSALALRRRTTLRTSPAAAVAGSLLFFVGVGLWDRINEALSSSAQSLESRLQPGTRWQNWGNLLDAAASSPWTGYGWTQVRLAVQQAARTADFPEAMVLNSHNLVLDLLLWNGIPLGLAILGVLVWWYARRWTQCRRPEQWLLLLAVSAVLIHAMLEYPLEYTYFLLPLGLLIGALETASATRTWKLPGLAYGAALSVPAALVIVIGMEYMKVEESARQIRFMMVGIEQESGEPPPPPEVRLLDGLREYHRFWLQPARPGMGGDEVDRLRKVAQRYPAPPALLRLALASALNGRAEEAVRTLTVICRMHGEDRCKEGRDSWAAAGQKYPALVSIPFPVAASSIVAGPR